MDNKYVVRIIRSKISCFKNVNMGEVTYMNYESVNSKCELNKTDIVGIYGQNGSGKTALVEALDVLRYILMGQEIPYDDYAGLLHKNETSIIESDFYIEKGEEKYKARYEAFLKVEEKKKSIHVYKEKLIYWRKGSFWKAERDMEFANPYYEDADLLGNYDLRITSKHLSCMKSVPFLTNMQNLALICSQKNISIFFNLHVKDALNKLEADDEIQALKDVIVGILQFGHVDFNVIKVTQLGIINRNQVIPINIHTESDAEIVQWLIHLSMIEPSEIPKEVYEQVQSAVTAINMALKAIIPKLQIRIEEKTELEKPDGTRTKLVEIYAIRGEKHFLLRYESEGIKRIISILNYLISVYNNPGVCLVVDELDSGIFEYLLGELIGLMNREMKGQLIFTSHNLRVLEKLGAKNIVCSTVNPDNRYIRLKGIEKNNNKRDFYIRAITVGGQKEELYDEDDLLAMGYALRKAGKIEKDTPQIKFSPEFEAKYNAAERRG